MVMQNKYYCSGCHSVVDVDSLVEEREPFEHFGYIGSHVVDMICRCGSDDLRPAVECDYCCDYVRDNYYTLPNGKTFCSDCIETNSVYD